MLKTVVITGPTATGKTRMGVALAKKLGGEVVSADSMQLYKYMDVGTAKPTAEETEGVPHHMIDVAGPDEDYSVSRYVEEAARCIEDITSRGKLPIIVGGTGLYIDSLISGREFAPRGSDSAVREKRSWNMRCAGRLWPATPPRGSIHPTLPIWKSTTDYRSITAGIMWFTTHLLKI